MNQTMSNYNPYSLEGMTILITGASAGIGRATAIECSKLGAKVILVARNEERLKGVMNELEGDDHQYISCDLTSIESVFEMVDNLPVLDGVVLNAGVSILAPILFFKEETVKDTFSLNTISPMMTFQRLAKKRKLQKDSSVVFTSSIAGLGSAAVGEAAYMASKGAISAFIKGAALELSKKGVRVNAVCPGMVQTEMTDAYGLDENNNPDLANYPLGRYGQPIDIAHAIIYLLSKASSWVTGSNLIIDGGLTIK